MKLSWGFQKTVMPRTPRKASTTSCVRTNRSYSSASTESRLKRTNMSDMKRFSMNSKKLSPACLAAWISRFTEAIRARRCSTISSIISLKSPIISPESLAAIIRLPTDAVPVCSLVTKL